MSRAHSPTFTFTSHTSQLILQPFRRFTYVTAHSPTLPLLHLRHSSFSSPSFASPTSQALHLIHLASRPCSIGRPRLEYCFGPLNLNSCYTNEHSFSVSSQYFPQVACQTMLRTLLPCTTQLILTKDFIKRFVKLFWQKNLP